MKISYPFSLFLLLLAVAAIAQAEPTPYPGKEEAAAWPGGGPIRVFGWMTDNRDYFWTQRETDQNAIVFVGDSLMHGWSNLESDFSGYKVVNRSIGGDVSRGLLFRFKEDVIDLNPTSVVLLIGMNDLSAHAKPSDVVGNIEKILELLKDHDKELPVLLCTLPLRDSAEAPTQPGALPKVNRRIKKLAADYENVQLLDLSKLLAKEDGSFDPQYHGEDRLHLSPVAYERWTEAVRPFLSATGKEVAVVAANDQWDAEWVDPASQKLAKQPADPTDSALAGATSERVPTGYQLTFSDEFNGKIVDESKWFHRYIYDNAKLDHLNDEVGRRVDRSLSISDNALTIMATPREGEKEWDTGLCRSKWTFKYGYLETAVKFPANRGAWPSFWINSGIQYPNNKFSRLNWPPEIDIFELVNNGREGPHTITSFVHGKRAAGKTTHSLLDKWGSYKPGYSLADGRWHVISCLWTPDESTTWVNGVKIVSREFKWLGDDGTKAAPAHILLDMAVGGGWPGDPTTKDPMKLQFDYLRVYQPSTKK